jgi:hypothetical protein
VAQRSPAAWVAKSVGCFFDTALPSMGGDVIGAAKQWAKAGLRSPAFAAKLRCEYDTLLDLSVTANGLVRMTSAAKNGVSYAGSHDLTPLEKLEGMGIALDWIALGVVPSTSRTLGRF